MLGGGREKDEEEKENSLYDLYLDETEGNILSPPQVVVAGLTEQDIFGIMIGDDFEIALDDDAETSSLLVSSSDGRKSTKLSKRQKGLKTSSPNSHGGYSSFIDDGDGALPFSFRKDYGFQLLDEALEDIGAGKFHLKLLLVTCFGVFVDAAETSMLSLLFADFQQEWNATENQLALIGSLTAIGMMIGATFFGMFSDRYGRKLSYQISLLFCALFGFISSFANSVVSFAVLRLFLGFGYGGNLVAGTTLLVEYTPSSKRGLYIALNGVAYGIGAVTIVSLSWVLIPTIGWKWLVRVASILAIPVLLGLVFVPESVRFYVMTKQHEKAVACMERVATVNGKKLPPYFTVNNLRAAAAGSTSPYASSSSSHQDSDATSQVGVFGPKGLLRRPVLATLIPLATLWFTNSFASAIFGWVPLEMKKYFQVEKQDDVQYAVGLVLAIGGLVGTIVVIFLTLVVRRTILLRIGPLLCVALTVLLGFARSHLTLYILAFMLNISEVITINTLYLYTPEVFPTGIRVQAFGVCQLGHRLAPAIAPFTIAYLDSFSFQLTCIVFGAIYATALLSSMFLRIETFGKPLVEEDDYSVPRIVAEESLLEKKLGAQEPESENPSLPKLVKRVTSSNSSTISFAQGKEFYV